jgi:hypothetical protein
MRLFPKTVRLGFMSIFMSGSAFAASGPITVNLDVPAGHWKAARLKDLPKDATVALWEKKAI